ncbi:MULTISPECIES: type II secretion system protein [unclassified Neochlamydia]|uniref:type II secretion system protein n=1 Tax=unclassified Neochlamydia TaxID=2643326 RepID=UPI001407312E|nr:MULTISPECIES: type II secretion system protein [unclassified Neochlamydia]MBS4167333.1 Uncharacterized protein [Neochlamydia sp. AcF65]MBS4169395.1 Uncharacterized protein [Neochlamydia sp. AcF95]NGY96060.1 hypothetical protein [Neochlamydia sp. AcF84]
MQVPFISFFVWLLKVLPPRHYLKRSSRPHSRRHVLLLEVLIAFALTGLCIFPLIYPQVVIAKSQREFIKKIELDRVVTLLFAQIYQDLFTNKINWADIEEKKSFSLSAEDLKALNQQQSLPFKGSYHFEPIIHKPKKNTSQQKSTAYLIHLIFKFTSDLTPKNKINVQQPLVYKYKIFILRDLRGSKLAPQDYKQPFPLL